MAQLARGLVIALLAQAGAFFGLFGPEARPRIHLKRTVLWALAGALAWLKRSRARFVSVAALALVAGAQGCAGVLMNVDDATNIRAEVVKAEPRAVRLRLAHEAPLSATDVASFRDGAFQAETDGAIGLAFHQAAQREAQRRGWAGYRVKIDVYRATLTGRTGRGGYRDAKLVYLIEGVVSERVTPRPAPGVLNPLIAPEGSPTFRPLRPWKPDALT